MSGLKDAIKEYQDGVSLNLFVTPKAPRSIFPAGYNQWRKRIEIKVVSEAKGNKANQEVVKTIADYFHTSERNISVVRGEKSREKTLFIKDMSTDKISKKLKESFDGL